MSACRAIASIISDLFTEEFLSGWNAAPHATVRRQISARAHAKAHERSL